MANLRNALTIFIGRFRRGRLAQYGISLRRMRRRALLALFNVRLDWWTASTRRMQAICSKNYWVKRCHEPLCISLRRWSLRESGPLRNSFAGVRFVIVSDAGCGHRHSGSLDLAFEKNDDFSVSTVANTIFPSSLWRPNGSNCQWCSPIQFASLDQ
jgi:hypothetical protein